MRIVIPIYRQSLSAFESVSFYQALRVFSGHPFSLVYPAGLEVGFFIREFQNYNIAFTEEPFEPSEFNNVDTYNLLMLKPAFYDRFIRDEYILVYQLDSYVFRDDLEKWCGLGYDYIGAPWVFKRNRKLIFKGVGNGGFSLRKPAVLKRFLFSRSLKMNAAGFWKLYAEEPWLTRILQLPKIAVRLLGYHNRNDYFFAQTDINEDYVFGHISQYSNQSLKVPPVDLAMQFAFDKCPKELFEKNNHELPFGCHGWYQDEETLSFWRQFITEAS